MINVEYSERFLRDLKKLKRNPIYQELREYCFENLPLHESLSSIKGLKKIQGYKNYYRISSGDYRIGLKKEGNTIILMRVLHRKDIYKFFP